MKKKHLSFDQSEAINYRSRVGRSALAKMITKLFDLWNLDLKNQLLLLGLSEKSGSTLVRYRKGQPLANRRDLLDRVAIFLSIHQSLRTLFPNNRELAYSWLRTSNRQFENFPPIEVIEKDGFLGLLNIKRYLDSEMEK